MGSHLSQARRKRLLEKKVPIGPTHPSTALDLCAGAGLAGGTTAHWLVGTMARGIGGSSDDRTAAPS